MISGLLPIAHSAGAFHPLHPRSTFEKVEQNLRKEELDFYGIGTSVLIVVEAQG